MKSSSIDHRWTPSSRVVIEPAGRRSPQPSIARRAAALVFVSLIGSWTPSTSLAQGVIGLRSATTQSGTPYVFALGNRPYLRYRLANGSWSTRRECDVFPTDIARNRDGRLELFRGNAHCWEQGDGTWSRWSTISGWPTNVNAIGVHRYWTGLLNAWFSVGDQVFRSSQEEFNGRIVGWTTPVSFGQPAPGITIDGVVAATNLDLREETFVVAGHQIYHIWQERPGGGTWSSWTSLGRPGGERVWDVDFEVETNADGRLEIFVATAGGVFHAWQVPGGGWSPWALIGRPIPVKKVVVGRNDDGRLELFAVEYRGLLQHAWQTAPNGPWSAVEDFGSPQGEFNEFPALTVLENADGRLELFAASTRYSPHRTIERRWQLTPGGATGWSGWTPFGSTRTSSTTSWASTNQAENVQRRLLSFRPSVHGWPFTNDFTVLASLLRGFCAGMVYTSMEEFYQGHWVSRGTPRPANGSPFWDRLYQRQVDSLLEDVPRLTTWYFKSAEEMGRDVPAEWRDIQATIDRGELAPVLLIADGTLNIAESHVVLAYGYQWDEAWGNLVLNVYDPNRPGDDAAHVVIEFGGNHVRVALVEGTGSGRSFRGFYSKHYDRTPQAYPTDRGYGNTEDSRLLWMMDVDGDGEDDLVRYEPELQRFEIGKESPSKICFQDAGSTVQFGNLADGRPFLHGDFAGIHGLPDGLEDLIFYYPAQRAWWLGRSTGRGFEWISIGTTTGFGALWPGVRLWAADFDGDGAKDVLFHQPNDGNWWKGSMTSQGLAWTNVGNTTSFGQLLDGRPLFVGDFTGDQREDVLFYYEPHNKFWIGESDGAQLHWRGHDAPGRGPSASSPLAAGAFEGGGRHRILCRDPNGDRWILGRFDGGSVSWSVVGSDPASGEPDGARRFVLDLEGDGREELWIGTRNSGRHHVASIDPTGSLRWTDVPFYGILADEWVRRAEALFTGRGGSGRPGRQVRTSHVITPNNTQYLVSDLFTTLPMFLTRHLSCSAFGIDRFGSGCVGSNMQRVQLLGRGSSRLGESASLDTERALPGAPVWLAIGLSNTSWLGIPLPLDHTPFGAPGCYSYIDRILYVAGLASQTGGASFPTTWPNDPAIAGVVLYFQALCLDAGANALGMTSTNGVGIEIGALW